MEKDIDYDEDFHKIKVFSSEDEKLQMLGELLSSKSSRDIIKLLIEKEMYTNEIAKKLDLRVNLVIHHLRKMEEIGILEIKNKKIVKKGNEHKHYKINSYFFLALSRNDEEIQEKRTLKKIFKNGIKFASIFFAGVIPIFIHNLNTVVNSNTDYDRNLYPTELLFFGSVIIIIGLIVERIFSIKKRKRV